MNEEQVAEILLRSEAVLLRPENPFRFSSGILSPVYCDNRLLLSKVETREKIVESFISKIKEKNLSFEVVAGIATASIPWAALVAEKLKKPMIYIRKSSKDHGRENLIEGGLKQGQKVLIVEDLVSTGGTSISSVKATKNEGGVVEECLAIFTYEMQKAKQVFSDEKCRLVTLSDFTTLTKVAAAKGFIKEDYLDMLKEWKKDPESWKKN